MADWVGRGPLCFVVSMSIFAGNFFYKLSKTVIFIKAFVKDRTNGDSIIFGAPI